MPSETPIDERPFICDWLKRLLLAVPSPWRRVSALSVTESGRLSAVAADSKLTDSLGAPNRHFGVREPRVGSSEERDEKGDTGPRWETPWWLLWRRSNGGRWPGGRKNYNMGIIRSESPARIRNKGTRGAGGGPCCRCTAASLFWRTAIKPISYLNTLFRKGGGGLKETEPIWILHINGARGRLCQNA